MPELTFALHVTVAMLLGAAIGLERQWRQRMAGLRTNALVALGAAIFVALSVLTGGGSDPVDPTRIAAQVVSGVGFLCGGILLREGVNVRGLNTAATLWCSAGVGTLAGLGQLLPAAIATLLILAANVLLRPIVLLINRQPLEQAAELEVCYLIDLHCRSRVEFHLRTSLLQESTGDAILLRSIKREALAETGQVRLTVEFVTQGRNDRLIERIASRIGVEPGVSSIVWAIHSHSETV